MLLVHSAVGVDEAPPAVPVAGEPFQADLRRWTRTGKSIFLPARTAANHAGRRPGSAGDECTGTGQGGALVLADGSLLAAETVAADKEKLTVDSDVLGHAEAAAGSTVRV